MNLDDFDFEKCRKYVIEHEHAFLINSAQGIKSIVAEYLFCEGLYDSCDVNAIVGILNKTMLPGSACGSKFFTLGSYSSSIVGGTNES